MGIETLYQEPSATVYCGHALDLKELPPESVDMCMTSPPYWGLRSYKTEPQIWDSKDGCRHEWQQVVKPASSGSLMPMPEVWGGSTTQTISATHHKQFSDFCSLCGAWRGELGLEPTIELYISHLLQIFDEVKRVLKKTGTCWVVIDDSYAGSWGDSDHRPERDGIAGYQRPKNTEWFNRGGHYQATPPQQNPKGIQAKSLCLIPSRFALAMVETGWILRNDIVWNKPNPMPESVKDRFTTSWEHLFFFAKSKRYFFEQQFEPMAYPKRVFSPDTNHHAMSALRQEGNRTTGGLHDGRTQYGNPELGRQRRDVWEIGTVPSPKHDGIRNFATYPEKLCETPILAGCPSMICKKCGKARERIYEATGHANKREPAHQPGNTPTKVDSTGWAPTERPTDNYTDCGCNAGFEPGVVLDPFMGSGTTLATAKRLGRRAIGVDISQGYCKLAIKRLQEISMPMELVA